MIPTTEPSEVASIPVWIQTTVTILGVVGTALVGIYGFMRKRAHEETRTQFETRDNISLLKEISATLDGICELNTKFAALTERGVLLNERNAIASEKLLYMMEENRRASEVTRIADERIERERSDRDRFRRHDDDK